MQTIFWYKVCFIPKQDDDFYCEEAKCAASRIKYKPLGNAMLDPYLEQIASELQHQVQQ